MYKARQAVGCIQDINVIVQLQNVCQADTTGQSPLYVLDPYLYNNYRMGLPEENICVSLSS